MRSSVVAMENLFLEYLPEEKMDKSINMILPTYPRTSSYLVNPVILPILQQKCERLSQVLSVLLESPYGRFIPTPPEIQIFLGKDMNILRQIYIGPNEHVLILTLLTDLELKLGKLPQIMELITSHCVFGLLILRSAHPETLSQIMKTHAGTQFAW